MPPCMPARTRLQTFMHAQAAEVVPQESTIVQAVMALYVQTLPPGTSVGAGAVGRHARGTAAPSATTDCACSKFTVGASVVVVGLKNAALNGASTDINTH